MHNIEHYNYPENISKKDVFAKLNHYVHVQTEAEGGTGLEQIRWLDDVICDSYDDAKKYIEEHDRGWYDQLAVRYRETSVPKTKGYLALVARRKELSVVLNEKKSKIHYAHAKSALVSCKVCGSKLATKFITSNYCPMCRNDLRPESILNSIKTSERMLKEVNKKIKNAEIAFSKKQKAGVRWLVKIEYHT